MSVLGRLILDSAERLDLPDALSIDSYTASDFKYLLQGFVGNSQAYILKGFDIINPGSSLGTENISIRIADSIVYFPESGAGSFFHGLPEGNTKAEPLVPELQKNATNYVYITFDTEEGAKDSRAFWDPDMNSGKGGEYSQEIDTQSVLICKVGVSTSTFPEKTVPIATVKVGATVIDSISDARYLMFRLGAGGPTPNAHQEFPWRENPSSSHSRNEPSTVINEASQPNPFFGADKNIHSMKEWMDAVMTRIKEVSGSTYWYRGSNTSPNAQDIFTDALGSTIKSKGEWQHHAITPGQITWTEDIHYYSLIDPRNIVIRASTKTLTDPDTVLFVDLIRNADINTTGTQLEWSNGNDYINGVLGSFENVTKGDWVKQKHDDASYYLRIEELYADENKTGGVVTDSKLAKSVKLNGNYQGTKGSAIGEYTKGSYVASDLQIESRDSSKIQDASGNFYWLAHRSDTQLGFGGAISTTLSMSITEADGKRAKCTTLTNHNLVDGDRITITAGDYAGTYQVEVEDPKYFFIHTDKKGDKTGVTGIYAVITTAARATDDGFALESANHNFEPNQRIKITDTGTAYDGTYLINVRSDTEMQIPISANIPSPSAPFKGLVSLPKVNVRTEFGVVKVVQGKSFDIGEADTTNILKVIGMHSLAQNAPVYDTPDGYNALDGHQNYNSEETDDLITRISKLTAMMADRVQERGITFVGRTTISNKTAGSNQNISATNTLTIKKPSSPDQVITLTASIPEMSAAVATIDRNGNAAINLTVESLGSQFLLEENKIILFSRYNDTTVYDWNGNVINNWGSISTDFPEDAQSKNIIVYNSGNPDLNPATNLVTLDMFPSKETFEVTAKPASAITAGRYFVFYSAKNATKYYGWFEKDGAGTDPALAGATAIKIAIVSADTDVSVATKIASAINANADFTASSSNTIATITCVDVGATTKVSDGPTGSDTGLTYKVTIEGNLGVIEILVNGSANKNIIDATAINALSGDNRLLIPDNYSAWIRVDRNNLKTFKHIIRQWKASATYAVNEIVVYNGQLYKCGTANSDATFTIAKWAINDADTLANGGIYITQTQEVPKDQDVFVLFMRNGDNLLELHKAILPDDNVYEERLAVVTGAPVDDNQITGPLAVDAIVQLPLDSRDNNEQQYYVRGAGLLEIFLNGQYLSMGEDWEEIGPVSALSSRIKLKQPLVVGDYLDFRIDSQGSIYFATPTPAETVSLQSSYNTGRVINVLNGSPIVINGTAGTKLMTINGDLDVKGVIDPTGLAFDTVAANPLGGLKGLWIRSSDNALVYETAAMLAPSFKVGTLASNTELTKTNMDALLALDPLKRDMSNLSPTGVNLSVIPAATNSNNLGSTTKEWKDLNVRNIKSSLDLAINGTNIVLTGSGIKLVDGSQGTVGQCWVSTAVDGKGKWEDPTIKKLAQDLNIAATYNIKMPAAQGSGLLSNDGAGNLSWFVLPSFLPTVTPANDMEIPRFDGNGNKLKNSGITINNSNDLLGINNLTASNLIHGNKLRATELLLDNVSGGTFHTKIKIDAGAGQTAERTITFNNNNKDITLDVGNAGNGQSLIYETASKTWKAGAIAGSISEWQAGGTYTVGSTVYTPPNHANVPDDDELKIWRCATANTDANFTNTKWVEISMSAGGISLWAAGETYKVNDLVVDPTTKDIYICTVAGTAAGTNVASDTGVTWLEVNTKNTSFKTTSADSYPTTPVNMKFWKGTKVEYDAIGTKDNNTIYHITDYAVGAPSVPIGGLIPVLPNLDANAWQVPASGAIKDGFMLADGTAITAANVAAGCKLAAGTVLPDMNNKYIKGSGTSGSTGGSNTVALTTANIPAHTHTANHNHTASSNTTGNHSHTTNNTGAHNHTVHANRAVSPGAGLNIPWGSTSGNQTVGTTSTAGGHTHSTNTTGNHSHTITVNSKNVTTSSVGSGTAFSIQPSYYTVVYVIRVL